MSIGHETKLVDALLARGKAVHAAIKLLLLLAGVGTGRGERYLVAG